MVFINVSGLLSKLNFPDFIDLISEYALICICESKLDDADIHNVDLDSYQFIPHNRKKALRKSGGIGIFVKNECIDNSYISFPKNDVENIVLFKLNQALCGYEIIGGVVYTESEGSRYADNDSLSVIEEKLLEFGNTPIIHWF